MRTELNSATEPTRQVFINGRFLSQRTSGVQRFARELVKALDALLGRAAESTAAARHRRWTLLVPRGTACDLPLRHIGVREVGGGSGPLWDQALRWQVGRHDLLLNLANSGPIWHARSVVILHDAAVYRTPHNYTRTYRGFHQILGRLLAQRAVIGTVSQFSREEIAQVLDLDADRIFVVPNGCEHLRGIEADERVIDRLDLRNARYFLFIGSSVPNKNLATALAAFDAVRVREAAAGNSALRFVIVGAGNSAVYGQGLGAVPEGTLLAGAASDREVKALLQHASGLLFPSLYEGFGIPPLEAMLNRCPVIASDIPPVREVCGDAALRVPPTDAAAMACAMKRLLHEPALRTTLIERGERRAAHYDWSRSARRLLDALDGIHPSAQPFSNASTATRP